MKKPVKITGMALALLVAITGNLSGQRGMRMMQDTARFRGMQHMQMRSGFQGHDSLFRGGMHRRMNPMAFGNPMRPGMGPQMRGHVGAGHIPAFRGEMWRNYPYGMRRGFVRGPGFGMRQGMMPGRQFMRESGSGMRLLETIPNLSEKQEKDIGDLRTKQLEEMKKFREDMSAKMNVMREANRTKIMNLLTEEQKKNLEGNKQAVPEKK